MADFHQNGNITTLHNLRTRALDDLEYELTTYAQTRRISLILPSLFSELEGEALPHIVNELRQVPYLHRIIVGSTAPKRRNTAMPAAFSTGCRRPIR